MSNKNIFLFLTIILYILKPIHSTVLGIDFGSEIIKVASVSPGRTFDIVLDETSKRSHPSLVVFDNDVRQYGTSASTLVSRRPLRSFFYFQRLLGKPYNTSMIDEVRSYGSFGELLPDEDRGTLRYKNPYLDPNAETSVDDIITASSYSIEEISSMKLKHIREIAEKASGNDVIDCVITVPDYWTMFERQALLDAAELAGLNVFSLINENGAAALQYGLNLEYSTNTSSYYIFYNMGSTSTKVSLVKYFAYENPKKPKSQRLQRSFQTISQTFNEKLGAKNFDLILVDILLEATKKLLIKNNIPQEKIDQIHNNPKLMIRIHQAANRAKKILSANTDRYVNIEAIYEDFDLATTVTREELYTEARKRGYFDNLLELLNGLLEDQDEVDKENIEGIILVGGGTRIPGVRDVLKNFLSDKPLREDFNADEGIAMGAVFRAANLSSAFKVRSIGFEDITPYPVGVRVNNLIEEEIESNNDDETEQKKFSKRGSLFSKNNRLHKRRSVSFKHNKNVKVSLFYEKYATLSSDIQHNIAVYNVTGIEKACKKYIGNEKYNITNDPKISLSFLLDSSGIIDMVSATATFTEWYTIERAPKKTSKTDTSNDETTTDDSSSQSSDTPNESDSTSDTNSGTESTENNDETSTTEETTENSENSDSSTESTEDSSSNDETQPPPESKPTQSEPGIPLEEELKAEVEVEHAKRAHKVQLDITKTYVNVVQPYNVTDFETSLRYLEELNDRDKDVLDTNDARNALESFIFEHRGMLHEDSNVEKVSSSEEREKLIEALNEAEDWIWEQEVESKKIYNAKTNELKTLCHDVFLRALEMVERPKTIDLAGTTLHKLYQSVEMLEANYSWVSKNDTQRLFNMTKRIETWLNEKIEEQSEKLLTEKPAFLSNEITYKLEPAMRYAQQLLSRQPPKDYWKKLNEEKLKKNNQTNTTGDSDATTDDTTSTTDDTNQEDTTNTDNSEDTDSTNGDSDTTNTGDDAKGDL